MSSRGSLKSDSPKSRPGSQPSSRPGSAVKTPPSSRPPSTSGSGSGSKQGSRPASTKGRTSSTSRPSSTKSTTADRLLNIEHKDEPEGGSPHNIVDANQTSEGGWAIKPSDTSPTDQPDNTDTAVERRVPSEEDYGFGDAENMLTQIDDDNMLTPADGGVDGDEEDETSDEMVVLDPDHPLMRRFQAALERHLTKQRDTVTLQRRELDEAVRTRKRDRERLGVELYGAQQELAAQQATLERHHDRRATAADDKRRGEEALDEARAEYEKRQTQLNHERKKGADLQKDVENLALRLFYMQNAKDDVRSDISVMKRAAEKADAEVAKAEVEKKKQDLFVQRLDERVDQLRSDVALYDAQLSAASDETRAARDTLAEARVEIEGLGLEKKELFQQWNSSLIGMQRRDEAHAAMLDALSQQQQQILSLLTEIDGYKKSITKEQENNEKLTLVLNKTKVDINAVEKALKLCIAKHEALKNEYSTYSRMLHETEQALSRASTDKMLKSNEVNALRKQIEKEYAEKVSLEDKIIESLRSQMTLDKASQYTKKITDKLSSRTRDMNSQVAQVENEISRDTLEISNTKTRIQNLKKIMTDINKEIAENNEIISRSEVEVTRRNAVIERKQSTIDQYNKRLEHMISSAGGVELGPLEIQINSIQKSIESELNETAELQQMWLREQSQLVQLTRDKYTQSKDVQNLKKKITILAQKKLRIEAEIEMQRSEKEVIERSIRNMHNDMVKLNMLLHKEKNLETGLEQDNVLMENDFVGRLKEAEENAIKLQEKLNSTKEEKERLLNSLVESERQIMLWEKKTQLARETKNAVDSEVGQGEVRAMKAEIHRMQVRHSQLMKQQERMIQDMEKAVSRRETIVTRGDAQSKTNKNAPTKGTFQRQMGELRKKIKQTLQDASDCDNELRELRSHQMELSHRLEERQLNVRQLQESSDNLDGDIDQLMETKTKNLNSLIAKQQRSKYYQQVKSKRYTRVCKSDMTLDEEMERQMDRLNTLAAIVDRLGQEFPHVQPVLRPINIALSAKLMNENISSP